MGSAPGKRKVGGDHKHRKTHKLQRRGKFQERHIDQLWEDIRKEPKVVHDGKTGPIGTSDKVELNEDIPGYGQHFCLPCNRYFQSAAALADHDKTKPHKRRVRMLLTSARPHNQRDAEAAGGMGAPDNGPKLRRSSVAVDMDT